MVCKSASCFVSLTDFPSTSLVSYSQESRWETIRLIDALLVRTDTANIYFTEDE